MCSSKCTFFSNAEPTDSAIDEKIIREPSQGHDLILNAAPIAQHKRKACRSDQGIGEMRHRLGIGPKIDASAQQQYVSIERCCCDSEEPSRLCFFYGLTAPLHPLLYRDRRAGRLQHLITQRSKIPHSSCQYHHALRLCVNLARLPGVSHHCLGRSGESAVLLLTRPSRHR